MRLLQSYVPMSIVSSLGVYRSSRVESSVRILFSELVKYRGPSRVYVARVHTQFPEGNGLGPRSTGYNVEMKRGDWICTRCSFMNFAKNKNCLKCEEVRPNKILTGGEWECPECDFFNFGRNVVCLRCDCKKPDPDPLRNPVTVSGLGANISSVKSNTEKPLTDDEGKQQPWFTKITQLEKSSDLTSSPTDEEFSKFMQARDDRDNSGSSDLAIDKNPDDIQLGELLAQKTSFSYTSNKDGDSGESTGDLSRFNTSKFASSEYGSFSDDSSDSETSASVNEQQSGKDLPEIMPVRTGENRFVISKKKDRSLTSLTYKRRVAMEPAGGSNHVPFVPFPPGYFSQNKSDSADASSKPKTSEDAGTALHKSAVSSQQTGATIHDPGKTRERNEHKGRDSNEASKNMVRTNDRYSATESSNRTDFRSVSQARETSSVEENSRRGTSLEGSAVVEVDPLDMSEEAKAERWFRRVAQIKDISELSQIPDEDFPSIMPLRKGVNRFVVSKRKTPLERRLTSSQYKPNLPEVTNEPLHDRDKTESS
ncbi:hypothetical protein RND81_08G015400 [Saponaria officinalis]|uniref:RanBP2-type domain-containing protein n=1 Tax=Saponaria officinalis TaxID=3572 RepID=A0AAW1J2W1_SAPOF